MKVIKIIFCVLFVGLVAFLVARGCWHPKEPFISQEAPLKIISEKEKAPVARIGPKMAIILDDWGHNLALVKNAEDVGRPLTLSVLPHLPHSRQIAEEAFSHGMGVMLHMPMQPKGSKQPLEPHTILTTMPEAQILEYLDSAIESIPHVEGVNNHQGSAATSDERVMRTVLEHLKKKGLFFVDSEVISTTVGGRVAEEIGISFTKRDVFLDNTATVEAVQRQLRAAEKVALSRGRVVAIGHAKRTTLKAIRATVPELEKNGVQLVLVKELLD